MNEFEESLTDGVLKFVNLDDAFHETLWTSDITDTVFDATMNSQGLGSNFLKFEIVLKLDF